MSEMKQTSPGFKGRKCQTKHVLTMEGKKNHKLSKLFSFSRPGF